MGSVRSRRSCRPPQRLFDRAERPRDPSVRHLREQRLSSDPAITGKVSAKAIANAFDLKRQLRNIDAIFARVFGTKKASSKPAKRRAGKS